MNAKHESTASAIPACYRVDDLLIDIEHQRVTRDGVSLEITGLSFELLLVLLRTAPNLVSVEVLMESVWGGVVVGSEAVTQRVKLIRQALGDDAQQPRYIAGVRGRGYRLVASVRPLPAATSDGSGPAATESIGKTETIGNEVTEAIAKTGAKPASWRPMTLLFGALIAMACAAWWLTHLPGRDAQPTVPAVVRNSIAVLPFVNYTGDASKDYLGEGMADAIINTLSKVSGLKVPARTSSFSYQGRKVEIQQIAKDLGVSTVLEGSVYSAGERIRITAKLIDAQNGFSLWSDDYDRKFTDVFALQDDLATAIVGALQVNLNDSAPQPVKQLPPTQDAEAYRLYLQGVALASRLDPDDIKRAVAYLQQAVARDPKFARAYAALGTTYQAPGVLDSRWRPGNEAAEQALALDPDNAEAHALLAGWAVARGDWLQAEAHDRAALRSDPNDGFDRAVYSGRLAHLGYLQRALQEARAAYALAPANPAASTVLAHQYSILGLDSASLKYADIANDLGMPTGHLVGVYSTVALRAGRYDEASQKWLELLKTASKTDVLLAEFAEAHAAVYTALADPQQRTHALALGLRLSQKISALSFVGSLACKSVGYSYTLLSATDIAYAIVNKCLDRTIPDVKVMEFFPFYNFWSPEMRLFRQDPRFQAYATRLGMMDYWKKYGPPDDCDLKNDKLSCH